jgi:hypothetical protein
MPDCKVIADTMPFSLRIFLLAFHNFSTPWLTGGMFPVAEELQALNFEVGGPESSEGEHDGDAGHSPSKFVAVSGVSAAPEDDSNGGRRLSSRPRSSSSLSGEAAACATP